MGWQRSFTLTQEDMGNRTFSCVTWSPNGKTLAVGYTDGTIQLFGIETGEVLCKAFIEAFCCCSSCKCKVPDHGEYSGLEFPSCSS